MEDLLLKYPVVVLNIRDHLKGCHPETQNPHARSDHGLAADASEECETDASEACLEGEKSWPLWYQEPIPGISKKKRKGRLAEVDVPAQTHQGLNGNVEAAL